VADRHGLPPVLENLNWVSNAQTASGPMPKQAPVVAEFLHGMDVLQRLQALYYVSYGVDIPPEHAIGGLVTVTLDAAGQAFDWGNVMRGFFRVHWAKGHKRPPGAHVAVRYKDYWFYIDDTDQETKSTFSLLMELARLELTGKTGPGPQLTLPVGGK
jgi:diadenosine tetraphosphatase ApaH/serine/threonine PP2A family protein phosphatase